MLLHRGRVFRDAESWISKKCRTMLKNSQKGQKMAIWSDIIVFITNFNAYGTDTKNLEDTERRFLKKW